MLQTEERTKECDSRGELGDMGVVAGDGAESQDQEVRAQRYRRELGEEERRHRRGTCVIYGIYSRNLILRYYSYSRLSFKRVLELTLLHSACSFVGFSVLACEAGAETHERGDDWPTNGSARVSQPDLAD